MNIPSPRHFPARPKTWEDDGWFVNGRPFLPDVEVYEEDEVLVKRSSLVQPNGDPIFYVRESDKLGFIGFLKPSWVDEEEPEDDDDETPDDTAMPDDQKDDRT